MKDESIPDFIPHPSSLILHPSSFIPHPSSLILHPSSFIPHPSSLLAPLPCCNQANLNISSSLMSDVTDLLNAIERGEHEAANQLLPVVYDELRRLAAQKLAREKPGQTLDATGLVHEAYLRLVPGGGRKVGQVAQPEQEKWQGRGHFFAAAAEAMRRILIENARRKKSPKHGGNLHRVDLQDRDVPIQAASDDLIAIDEALTKLALEDEPAAEVVKLRFYAGFSMEDKAEALGMSRATAYRHWTYARAWLRCALGPDNPSAST
jgi:RNA polymerase sigma factor (TIGR02999 family)